MIVKDRNTGKYMIIKNSNDYYNRLLNTVWHNIHKTNICYVNIIKIKSLNYSVSKYIIT